MCAPQAARNVSRLASLIRQRVNTTLAAAGIVGTVALAGVLHSQRRRLRPNPHAMQPAPAPDPDPVARRATWRWPAAAPENPRLRRQTPVIQVLVFEFATGTFIGTSYSLRPDIYQQGQPPLPGTARRPVPLQPAE